MLYLLLARAELLPGLRDQPLRGHPGSVVLLTVAVGFGVGAVWELYEWFANRTAVARWSPGSLWSPGGPVVVGTQRFLPWHDERVVGTVEAVQRELSEHGLLLRYRPTADGGVDGLPGGEGAFLLCSFWLADALHLGSGGSSRRGSCSSGCSRCATTWACSARNTTPGLTASSVIPRRRSATSGWSTPPATSAGRPSRRGLDAR